LSTVPGPHEFPELPPPLPQLHRNVAAIIPPTFTVLLMAVLVWVLIRISSNRLLGWRQLTKGKNSNSIEFGGGR
jgi:hypothetical protein